MKERKPMLRKCVRAIIGLVMFAFGLNMTIRAGIGVAPWDVLALGVSYYVPFTYGETLTLITVAVLGIDLLFKEKIGVGTVIDTLIVGKTTDFFNWTGIIPQIENTWVGILVMVTGIVIMAFGQAVYMKAGIGCGPKDSLLVAIGKKLRKLPVGVVNILLWVVLLAAGWALGGPVGIGTGIAVFGQGLALQFACHVTKFEPRDIEHYGIDDMWRDYKKRKAAR